MKKWTYKTCKVEALKYSYLHEFRKNSERAYKVSHKNNWMCEFSKHFKIYERPIKWSYELCKKTALSFTKRIDFAKNEKNCYQACARNNWLESVCNHMVEPYKNRFKWSHESTKEIASKYKTRKKFQNENVNAYSSARHNGWLNDICSHMEYKNKPKGYWDDIENCKTEALKYKVKSDFIKNSQHCYNMSLKNGFISNITKHMIPIGDRYNKCIYSYEFSDNHVYIGLTYNIDIRHKSRKYDKRDAVTIHKNKTGLTPIRKQLTNYIPVDDAIKLENKFLNNYLNKGWIQLNRRKTGGIGSTSTVWNFNRIKKLTIKYNNLDEFKNDDIELYNIAKRSGWVNSLF